MKKTVLIMFIIASFVLLVNAPPGEAGGSHHGGSHHGGGHHGGGHHGGGHYGWEWWVPWAVIGGAAVASSYYYPPPYYYPPAYYYPYYPPRTVVVAPPVYAVQQASSQSYQPAVESHFIYPRQGQNEKQQADDRFACHRWSVGQTGYDPTNSGGDAYQSSDYWRAMSACLDAHGYTVR